MEWVGKLVPHEPPEGLFKWETVQRALDVHALIYEAVWVQDTSLEAMLDEQARGRKIKAVKVRCSFCGQEEDPELVSSRYIPRRIRVPASAAHGAVQFWRRNTLPILWCPGKSQESSADRPRKF